MKKFSISFSLISLALLWQTPALAADMVVNQVGTAPVEKYYFHVYNAFGQPLPRENEEPKARERALRKAREEAKKLFASICKESKNGIPSRLTAVNVPAPGESTTCSLEWESSDEGTITCNARARGVCTVKESKDPRVSEQTVVPSRIEVINGVSYVITSSGAYPIVAQPAVQNPGAATAGNASDAK